MTTDWLPELDDDDLATLQEALEAWEVKDQAADLMSMVMEVALTDLATSPQFARLQSEEKRKRERARAVRKERSVILRAKLLALRNRRHLDRIPL